MHRSFRLAPLAVGLLIVPGLLALAADQPAPKPLAASRPPETPTTPPPAKPAPDAPQPSAEEVLNQLLKKRGDNPLIEPTLREPNPNALPPGQPRLAAGVTGIAPGAKPVTKLRREGQFIITRRGRLVRSATAPGGVGMPWMFVFDADANGLTDPPIYLLPCQLLEDMESVAQQQGDALVFVISGQVYVYHGANYLMPTLMKLAPHRTNLQP